MHVLTSLIVWTIISLTVITAQFAITKLQGSENNPNVGIDEVKCPDGLLEIVGSPQNYQVRKPCGHGSEILELDEGNFKSKSQYLS